VRGRDLVSRWHEKNSHIVTTNYDTIVERLLDDWWGTLPRGTERPGLADVQPIPVSSALAREGTGLIGSGNLETLTLYKIHGSINWFSSESDTNTDTIHSLPPEDLSDAGRMKYVRDKRRFIVPPVYDKSSLLNHDSIRSLWREAKMNALVPAERLFVVGYSSRDRCGDADAALGGKTAWRGFVPAEAWALGGAGVGGHAAEAALRHRHPALGLR